MQNHAKFNYESMRDVFVLSTNIYEINENLLFCFLIFNSFSLAPLLWDIGKQNSPTWDAAERGVPSGSILFA